MEACHVGGFDDFGKCDKFGKILSKCQMHVKGTNKVANLTLFRQGPKFKQMSSRQGYQQSGEFDEYGELANMANLTLFHQRPKFKRMSSRQGYQQSGKFDEYGEFGKYGEFDDISPKTKIQADELKTRVSTKWRI